MDYRGHDRGRADMTHPWFGGPSVDAVCPVCDTPSTMVLNAEQALCTNRSGCAVLMFNPSLPDGGLSNPQFVDLDDGRGVGDAGAAGEEK